MDELTPSDAEDGSSRSNAIAPPGMPGRWLAAIPGAAAPALLIGIAVARIVGGDDLAVASGGFMAVCAWTVLAALAVLQRSARAAWGVIGIASLLAAAWDVLLGTT
jgi:hypothetical protein